MRNMPWFQQRVRNLRNINGESTDLFSNLQNGVQKPQPISKFHSLSPENIISSLHLNQRNLLHLYPLSQTLVRNLQPAHLSRQILKLLLLPHPRPPSRFAVRHHPLPLPVVNSQISAFRSRTGTALNRSHSFR
uniref:Uncharacterized protein n=1 Tax=Lotus japonicus TaxID=34305 RepID=I3SNQ2_LOTJA|nr:unknown [Lotus japonicus]